MSPVTTWGHLLLHAMRPGAPTHFADLAKAYEVLEPETQEPQKADGYESKLKTRGTSET